MAATNSSEQDAWRHKLVSFDEIERVFSSLSTRKVALAGGCFDVLHIGHVKFFEFARSQADILVIVLEPDEKIRLWKHRKPVHTQVDRAHILSHIDNIDYIVMAPYMDTDAQYFELVSRIHPQVIVSSDADIKQDQKKRQAHSQGATYIQFPLVQGYSTTNIINGTLTRD